MYTPRRHDDHAKSLPGHHRRKRKNRHNNLKGWQPGDTPCPTAHCGCRMASGRGAMPNSNNRRAISRLSRPRGTTQQGLHRGKNLATEKKPRSGPNCDYHRCAANDQYYARPLYVSNVPRLEKHTREFEKPPKNKQKRSIINEETHNENEDRDVEDDTSMEEGEKEKPLNKLPENDGCQTCSERSECSCGSYQVDKTGKRQSSVWDTGLRPLTMKTVACNTDESCSPSCYYHAAQARARDAQIRAQTKAKNFQTVRPFQSRAPRVVHARVLKDIDSNATLVLLEKQPPKVSSEKMAVAGPFPRVALLRPSRPPASFQMLTKKDRELIQYANHQSQFQPSKPAIGRELVLHQDDYKIASPEVYLHSKFSQNPTPRRNSPRQGSPRQRNPKNASVMNEKWRPGGKPSPRLATPSHALRLPRDAATTPYHQQRVAQRPQQSIQQHHRNPETLTQMPTSSRESSTPGLTPPRLTPPTETSSRSSNDDGSDATKTSDTATSAWTSCFCRHSQSASRACSTGNPFYDIVSPMQSSARARGPAAMAAPGRWWAWLVAFGEVAVLLVLAGAFTAKLMPSVEALFRSFVAGHCTGAGVGSEGPFLMADGLKSGILNWMACPAVATASPS